MHADDKRSLRELEREFLQAAGHKLSVTPQEFLIAYQTLFDPAQHPPVGVCGCGVRAGTQRLKLGFTPEDKRAYSGLHGAECENRPRAPASDCQ